MSPLLEKLTMIHVNFNNKTYLVDSETGEMFCLYRHPKSDMPKLWRVSPTGHRAWQIRKQMEKGKH